MTQKEILFKAMTKAIEESNEKELQFIIAKREKDAAIAAYREFEKVENCQNLTSDKRGQGSKTAEIYCGDYDYVKFLLDALGELGIRGEFETYTIDGEWHVEVKL